MAKVYGKVSTKVPNYQGGAETVHGSPIMFGLTIPKSSRNRKLAEEFIKYCLSKEGQKHLEESSLRSVTPPILETWGKAPTFLNEEN